jgi:hypothetical protein
VRLSIASLKIEDSVHSKPGCLLPRIIISLVFASEGTQCLAIGDAKLIEAWNIGHGSLDEGRITKGGRFPSSMVERC